MGSASRKVVAGSPGLRMLDAASSAAIAASREDPANVGATLSLDHRFRIWSLADARRGGPSRSVTLAMAKGRSGGSLLWDVVREFTPNWFSVTMGTGALALALNQIPFPIPGIYDLAGGLWLLDILLFVLFTVIYAAQWIFFFDEARRIVRHSVQSMFLGAIPMGLATIVNGLLIFGGGKQAVWIAHGLWWLDVILSVICGLSVPFLMFTLQEHSIEKMTGVWLLPVVAAEVAAVSGALLLPCGFRRLRPGIPIERGHAFRSKVATYSDGRRVVAGMRSWVRFFWLRQDWRVGR